MWGTWQAETPIARPINQPPPVPPLALALQQAQARELAAREAQAQAREQGGFGRSMGDVGVGLLRMLPFVGRAAGDALRPEHAAVREAESERMALMKMALQGQAGGYTLAPGNIRMDAMNRPMAMAPYAPVSQKDQRTPLMKEAYDLYPDNPAARQRYIEKAREKGSGINLNIGGPGEKAESVALGTGAGDYYWKTIVPEADGASELVSNLNYAETLIPVTGMFTPERTQFYNALRGFGVDIGEKEMERLSKAQTLEALINIVALGRTSQLKGQISEKELDFIRKSVMGMRNDPKSNRMILRMMRSMASMKIYRRQYYDHFKRANPKKSMRDAAAEWSNFRDRNKAFREKDGSYYYFDDYARGIMQRGGTIEDAMNGWKAWQQ